MCSWCVLLTVFVVSLRFRIFIYIFFLFYFFGLDNMGFHYLIQIKIDWLIITFYTIILENRTLGVQKCWNENKIVAWNNTQYHVHDHYGRMHYVILMLTIKNKKWSEVLVDFVCRSNKRSSYTGR